MRLWGPGRSVYIVGENGQVFHSEPTCRSLKSGSFKKKTFRKCKHCVKQERMNASKRL